MTKNIAKSLKKAIKRHRDDIEGRPESIPPSFENGFYQKLEYNYENFFTHESQRVNDNQPLIKQIKRISFEISNICNYSAFHNKCPASHVKEKRVLSSEIVYKIIHEMAETHYDGVFAFHRYNEPLMDPRLFNFIRYAKTECPHSKILILTNGFYLTRELAKELAELDLWILAVSAYSILEYKRLIQLEINIPYYVFYAILDDIENIYHAKSVDEPQVSCNAPLRDLTVNVFGEVTLCCLDWKNKYTFGNLQEETIRQIIHKEAFRQIHDDLVHKRRNLDICKGCTMIR